MLHPCSELPAHFLDIVTDDDCLAYLEQTYRLYPGSFKGKGMYGHVFTLYEEANHHKYLAVKLLPYEQDADVEMAYAELRIACELNAMTTSHTSSAFQYTFGWIVCDSIPERWAKFIPRDSPLHRTRGFLYIFMERMDWPILTPELRFTRQELLVFTFFLLHGLWVARTRLGFAHRDIHEGNVMFQRTGEQEPKPGITVKVGLDDGSQQQVTLPFAQEVIPKYIDFGHDGKLSPIGRDALAIIHLMEQRAAAIDQLDEYDEENGQGPLFDSPLPDADTFDVLDFLRKRSEFSFLRLSAVPRTADKRKKLNSTCVFCPLPATIQYQGKESSGFCSPFCAKRIHRLSAVLPCCPPHGRSAASAHALAPLL